MLQNANGDYIEGKKSEMNLALSRATLASIEATGLKAVTSFLAPKGAYRVPDVVR